MPARGGDFNAFASQVLDASKIVAINESRMALISSADCCPLRIRNSVALARLTHGRNCPTSGQCSPLKTIYQEVPPKVRFGSLANPLTNSSLMSALAWKADVMRRPQPTCYTSVCSAYSTRPQLCEYRFARDTLASSLLEHLTLFQGENRTFLQTFPALVIQWH